MIRTMSLLWLLTVSGAVAVVLDPPKAMVTAVLGKDAVLPCAFTSDEATVLQVRWLKRGEDGVDVDVAVLNVEHGTYVEEAYLGRVARASESDTLQDGSVRLRNAVQADEGTYECHLITFPLGNFESSVRLKVLVPPLPTLNLGPPLEEGQGRTLAASCTAEGSPVPNVSWETAVRGETRSQQSSHPRSASVTSEFYVVPGRSMHGQALTCVVSHPGLQHKKKITHTLNVAYLSDASILGQEAEDNWVEGREGASLKCLGDGNPPPSYNWSRLDEPLPDGVRIKGDTLTFQRPLSSDDGGVYMCQVANSFATKEVQASVSIKGNRAQQVDVVSVSMIGAGVIAVVLLGLLVLVVALMACYHKRKTKRITEKYEEELTLTRENSIRRLHSSHSTDTRNQTEESLPLRSESRQGSFRGDSLCRESLRGGDSLCRDSRQGSFRADSLRETSLCSVLSEEAEGRSYSTLSTVREIETQTELPPPPPTPVQEERKEEKEEEAGEEEEDEEAEREQRDGEKTIKQAMTHFVQENGTLRAKPTTNGIYINGRGHLV